MKNVLVIDDDEAVRSAFQLALEDTSCVVTAAAGGREGLAKLRENEMDLVFLDLKMPEMDGIATLRRLREWNPKVRVYIVTAFADEFMEPLQAAAEQGFEFELIRKPLEREQIWEVVEAVLGAIHLAGAGGKGGKS